MHQLHQILLLMLSVQVYRSLSGRPRAPPQLRQAILPSGWLLLLLLLSLSFRLFVVHLRRDRSIGR